MNEVSPLLNPLPEEELIRNWKGDKKSPLVSVTCIAYNHELYISDTLNGIFAQKTDFPFEVIVHDDASTDKTQSIIKSYAALYPRILRPILQRENFWLGKGINATTNIVWPSARGKYIAWIEGDDYWTDENKLQTQVDFLEANPKYSLCSHGYSIVNDKNEIIEKEPLHEFVEKYPCGIEITVELYFKRWITKTLTVVFRKSALNFDVAKYRHVYDMIVFFNILTNGNGYWMNFNGANYRVHQSNSWFHDNQIKKYEKNYNSFKDLYSNHPGYQVLLNGMLRNNYYVIRQIWQEHNFVNMPYKKLAGYGFTFIKNIVSHKNSYKYFLSKLLGSKKSGDDKLKVNT